MRDNNISKRLEIINKVVINRKITKKGTKEMQSIG